ncbi:MAG: 5'-methylthioadenosine/S-adenosylhomocysteine nucleosidase family protein [Actinomycetota bacterium]
MSNPRVAFLAPMKSELRPLVKKLDLQRAEGDDGVFHTGSAGDVEVVASLTGIGMQPAAWAAERILDAHPVDHLIVVGIAGGVPPHSKVGDLIVPEVVVNGETGTEHRPARLGDLEPRGRLVSDDDFLSSDADVARVSSDGVTALDMETAAVAAVCEARQVPWSVFRAISDMAGDTDDSVLAMANPDGSANVRAVLRYLLPRPWQIFKLARLGRDAQAATTLAADAAIRACAQGNPGVMG